MAIKQIFTCNVTGEEVEDVLPHGWVTVTAKRVVANPVFEEALAVWESLIDEQMAGMQARGMDEEAIERAVLLLEMQRDQMLTSVPETLNQELVAHLSPEAAEKLQGVFDFPDWEEEEDNEEDEGEEDDATSEQEEADEEDADGSEAPENEESGVSPQEGS